MFILGLGKTTMATVIAKHFGYEALELNASDTRNKKSISEHLRDVVSNTSMSISSNGSFSTKKRLIIMDEGNVIIFENSIHF